MTQYYIGVKIITAWPEEKAGASGYAVKYEDGYISWSPADIFERTYYPMGHDCTKVSKEMVDGFVTSAKVQRLDEKTTLVSTDLLTGFVQHETSSCVDPANYDEEVGTQVCVDRVKDTLWKCLGFVVQWGRFGLRQSKGE